MLLAAIQAITDVRLQLPHATQLLLKRKRIGVFAYLLELIYTNNYTITFLSCYQFGQAQHLLSCIAAGIILKRYREVIVWIHSETNLRNETTEKNLGVLHPLFPFGRSSPDYSCGKSIDEI